MKHKATFMLAIIAATGTAASADIFSWAGGDGDWNDHTRWFGPANQYPDSIVDSATVLGDSNDVVMTTNIALGSLNVLNGASLYANHNSLFVSGDTQVNGSSSALVIRPSPALRDFDSDAIYIKNGSFLILGDSVVQADELISVESGSAILGVGTLEMNSTTGDLDVVDGVIWADDAGSNTDKILITRTQSSTSRLNWTHPNSGLIAWPGTTIDIQIPFTGALGGSLHISHDATILSENAIVTSANSEIRQFGGALLTSEFSVLEAPIIDVYGSMRINKQSVLRAPFIALRGTGEMGSDSELNIDATSIIFDSLDLSPIDDDGALVRFGVNSSTLNVNGGTTTITAGAGGQFDLDGFGAMTVNIADGSSLVLDVEFIERFESNDFDSILNIDGTLDVMQTVPMVRWTNASGTINLDGGTIQGRILENESLIQGNGSIDSLVLNYGTIIADGSTLFFDHLNLGGYDLATRGVLRAELGDISSAHNSGGYQFFGGDMYVGDGAGIQEVFESNSGIIFGELEGVPSLLTMNSGRVRGLGLILGAEFTTQGSSQLRASGANPVDWVRFDDTSVNTISGTLEVDGHSRIDAGAQFAGEGTIVAVHTGKTMNMTSGASLQDVGLENHGALSIGDFFEGVGQASVASLVLVNTSTLEIDLAGDNNGIEHDQLQVLGSASVSGTLEVGLVDGFSVSLGDVFTILTAQSVSGSFTNIDYSGLELGQSAVAVMYADHIDVMVTCRADLNADGVLDFFDISAFLVAFGDQNPVADFTNDGSFDFFDISAFLSAYGSGCP